MERLNALRKYDILDTHAQQKFDGLCELASLICEVPVMLISFIDEKRQWYKSKRGMDACETALDLTFCRYTIQQKTILEVEDTTLDSRFKDHVFVTDQPYIRFYVGVPLIDPDGHVLGTICATDTRVRKLNDNQKRALELLADQVMVLLIEQTRIRQLRQFESMAQLSADIIVVASLEGYFKEVNPSFTQLLGWPRESILTTSILSLVHPDDLQTAREILVRLSAGESRSNAEIRFENQAGEYLRVQWSINSDPETGTLLAIGRDITADKEREKKLRNSEDNFRSFFENAQGLMCTHDLDGRFLEVNSEGARLLGYSKEEMRQMSLFDLVPARHRQQLRAYLHQIQLTTKASGLMTILHKDGSYKIWKYNNIHLHSPDGTGYILSNSIDVTQSQRQAKELLSTQHMLLQTNEVARIGGWEVDLASQKVYWTEITRKIHEIDADYEPDVATGISFFKEGENREKIRQAVQDAITQGKSYDVELQLITAKGKEIWVRAIGNAEMKEGKCTRLYGTFQDIDEKKKTELQIIQSRSLLSNVLRAASEVSIIASDTEGIINVFNQGAEKLLGYKPEEVIGKAVVDLVHVKHELRERSSQLSSEYGMPLEGFQVLIHKAQREGSETREWTYRTKEGLLRPVLLAVTPILGHQQQIMGYLGVAIDLTARKEAEKELATERSRLWAFVEHTPAAVAMCDTGFKYIATSRKWQQEYSLASGHTGGLDHDQIFGAGTGKWKDIYQKCLLDGIVSDGEEVYRPDGWAHDKHVSWKVRPWYDKSAIGGIMVFVQDVTLMAIQKQELNQARLHAEQASMAKSEFLANMSHEIRTPLNGVIGFTDLVLKTELNETQKNYLDIVNKSAHALLGIINDILDFSKIEAGKLELQKEKCDIYEIAAQAAAIISFPVQSKGLEMLLNMDAGLPRFIWTDEVRLKQVLINLLSNASKFTDQGEIELRINMLAYDPAETGQLTCRFTVRDTGIGIRAEKQDKIFEAFLQEDGSTTKKYGGTGLGLTISNKLLAMMGSRLQLSSVPGKGSTFYFDLTMKAEPGAPIIWENADHIKNVLIVDDNATNRMILQQMLAYLKINTFLARDGYEALDALSKGAVYDAVLMDYHMPDMDGLETIRKIREGFSPAELPVVLLNSSADDAMVIKGCEELRVNYRLLKPVNLGDISLALSRLSQKESPKLPAKEPVREIIDIPLTVLIAEDNPVNMFLAKTVIGQIAVNARIIEAVNGVEALALCRQHLPDLIFMDVQMPQMNGYEATMQIRQIPSSGHIPIIALTAGNLKGEKEKCIQAGMDDFVTKPFAQQTLRDIFEKYISKSRSKENLSILTEELGINQQIAQPDPDPVSSHLDIQQLGEMYMQDHEFIAEFLSLTRQALLNGMSDLKAHHNRHDLDAIRAVGHKLKGAAASAFIPVITGMAARLEHLDHYDPQTVQKLLDELERETELVLSLVDTVVKRTTSH
ncbi:hypothetical protein GCM10011325_47850 [Dyadobacter sediminis]|nr:hypothetical protein GCM10011325_47850 [Dyadobacter sediminis]